MLILVRDVVSQVKDGPIARSLPLQFYNRDENAFVRESGPGALTLGVLKHRRANVAQIRGFREIKRP